MIITGTTRPRTNTSYVYTISDAAGKITVKEWKIAYNGKILKTNTSGSFKFHTVLAGKTVKLIAVVLQHGKEVENAISLVILAGTPRILSVEWQDYTGKAIGNKKVGYLDKIQLVIKTTNIPKGDILKVSVYEDENVRDRFVAGPITTSAISEKGYAYLYFNQLRLYQTKLNNQDWVDESEHEFYVKIEYKNHISQTEESIQLVIQNELTQRIDKPKPTNNPLVVGKTASVAKPKKIAVDFTFGVFLDGTLNNMYNTELRKKAEGKLQAETTGLSGGVNATQVYKDHGDADDMESSYENDLSNPAILFKNYKKNESQRQFKVYTEGMGTNTAPKSQEAILTAKDYKDDDIMQGPAFGVGSAGIMDRVRKSITDVVTQIKSTLNQKPNSSTGTIIFDVFGFSRGAAAARHFVHVITHGAYAAKTAAWKEGVFVKDKFGYDLNDSYAYKTMPAYGYLGQLLTEAKFMDEQMRVIIRFVGIYDTVPHYGLFQWNDIKQLGLDDVNKANYVVHIVAGDEHRANFSLVDISSVTKTPVGSGKKGGIELRFPGVHCDVGGAYEEGRPDNPKRIDATVFKSSLEPLRDELIQQGWFHPDELNIIQDSILRPNVNNYRLEGNRKKISNQYSYVPLHIMAEFCGKKEIPIDKGSLINLYKFTSNWIKGNTSFLETIKSRLQDYSFNGAAPFVYVARQTYLEPPIMYATNSPDASIYLTERNRRQMEGQAKMNVEADKKNEYIKFLRNHYLHWNSSYGQGALDTVVQKNYPNKENGKRKRHVR